MKKILMIDPKYANIVRLLLTPFGITVSTSGRIYLPRSIAGKFEARQATPKPGDKCLKLELVCRKCRQVSSNRSDSLYPWYLHDCYKVHIIDPEARKEIYLLGG